MLRRALALAALLSLTVLAGCLSQAPAASHAAPVAGATSNVGGSIQSVTSVFPGKYDLAGPYSRVLHPGAMAIKPGVRVEIPSPQGGSIELGLHLPDTKEKVPILLFSSPYMDAEDSIQRQAASTGVAPSTPATSATPPPTVVDPSIAVKGLIEAFVPYGYAVVTHSVRGTGGSDGCNDLMGPGEMQDIDAALTWLGTQDWSTGKIAMTGVSYDGSTPWTAAATGNPYVKTILPISGVPDLYGLMYRNGSAESRGPFVLNALYVEGGIDSGEPDKVPGRLCPEAAEGLALSGVAGVAGEDPTGYWQARNRKPLVEENYKGSIFSIQGLQDWNVDPSQVIPWVDTLESQGRFTHQLLGQWEHSWPDSIGKDGDGLDCPNGNPDAEVCNRADWKEIMLHWLDHELKGMDVDLGAPVQVADNLGRWRNEEHYPPHDTTWTTFNLNHGVLTTESGPAQSFILYPQVSQTQGCDPCQPPDPPAVAETSVKKAADFVLGPFDEDLLVVGLPKVHVTVTPQGSGGYMGATLIDRNPADLADDQPIGWTTMNLAFADGGRERHEVTPGMPLEAMMEIQPMDAVVPAGHQLVLRMWVLTAQDRLPTLPPSPISLETGGNVESVLVLPTVVRGPEVYFDPPGKTGIVS